MLRAGCCPATHRALRYIYQPGAMDDDAAIRAALLEAREAGDITITQYLNELKNLRAPGDAATAGGSSLERLADLRPSTPLPLPRC